MHNAELGVALLDAIIERKGILDLSEGARKLARRLARIKGNGILNRFVYSAYARKGWMVPNQYWTPGVLSPMPVMGKYYMHYGQDFIPPRELGRINAKRLRCELVMDNLGFCRFHRSWAEEMIPEIMGSLYDLRDEFIENLQTTASRISSRNASVFWESGRNVDFVREFLRRKQTVEKCADNELTKWIGLFEADKAEAAIGFWYEIHKGIQESLREF
jgi:glyceraldehyde-3-phosphate dehydrogenase (ferredoxin)